LIKKTCDSEMLQWPKFLKSQRKITKDIVNTQSMGKLLRKVECGQDGSYSQWAHDPLIFPEEKMKTRAAQR
jgi:hypothetical protein